MLITFAELKSLEEYAAQQEDLKDKLYDAKSDVAVARAKLEAHKNSDKYTGSNVHWINQTEALFYAAFDDGLFHLRCNVDDLIAFVRTNG